MSIKRMVHATAAVALTSLVILGLGAARTPYGSKVSGTFTMTYTQQHPVPVPDADGHVLLETASQGTNQSTGQTSYMAGAEVANAELADLTQGNGTHQGYVTMSQNGKTVVTRWSGKVATVMGADHKPVTTFQGSWTEVSGATGSGNYSGRITGPDSYVVDWRGEIELK